MAARLFVEHIMSPSRSGKIRQIGVWSIENDGPDTSMRDELYNALTSMRDELCNAPGSETALQVLGVDEMKEKEAVLKSHGLIFKYQDTYNPDSLAEVGKMIGLKNVVIGKIIQRRCGLRSATTHFQGQVLDLETGIILWSERVAPPPDLFPTTVELVLSSLIVIAVIVFLSFLSKTNPFYGPGHRESLRRKLLWTVGIGLMVTGFALYFVVLA